MSQSPLACIEIGGSGVQTVVFSGGTHRFVNGVEVPSGAVVAVAVPGHIVDGRVATASTLGWTDVDPAMKLGLAVRPALVCNDAEAAALGEWVLRGRSDPRLVFIGVGSGIGGAVVDEGVVTHCNLFGHQPGFGSRLCSCGRSGCLETVAAGWAMPRPLDGGRHRNRGTGDRHGAADGARRRTGPRRRRWWGGGALSATHRPYRCSAPRACGRRQHASARSQVGCGMGNA